MVGKAFLKAQQNHWSLLVTSSTQCQCGNANLRGTFLQDQPKGTMYKVTNNTSAITEYPAELTAAGIANLK